MRNSMYAVLLLAMFWALPASAQNVTCESRDGGYRECYSGFRYPPVLVRQLSNSSCVEGRSWGHRPGSIWVSKGCRATSQEGRGGGFRQQQQCRVRKPRQPLRSMFSAFPWAG